MRTKSLKSTDVEKRWFLVDASGKKLGRIATEIARILMGKHRPSYTPNADTGEFIVVVNAKNIELTGNKWKTLKYYRRSRFFGSLKETTAEKMLEKDPSFIIKDAVRGMLPKTKLGRQMFKKLKVYEDGEHPHEAQSPEALAFS